MSNFIETVPQIASLSQDFDQESSKRFIDLPDHEPPETSTRGKKSNLDIKESSKRITRRALAEEPQVFHLRQDQVNWYTVKYVTSSKPHGIMEPLPPMKYRCGCQEKPCFVANQNFICGHCRSPMNSYCIDQGSEGSCRKCFAMV